MIKVITEVMKGLVGSKKFWGLITSSMAIVLIKIAGKYGIILDEPTASSIADRITGLAAVWLGAQGLADHGKEAEIAKGAVVLMTPTASNGKS